MKGKSRGSARVCRAALLFGLLAALLGLGTPALGRLSAAAADSRAPAITLPASPSLAVADAAALLRPAVPRGYHGTQVPQPAPAPSRSAVAAPAKKAGAAAPVTPKAAPATPATPVTTAPKTTPAPAPGGVLPLKVATGNSTQVVTVVASSASATTAKLTTWQKGANGWTAVLGPLTAHIGKQGVGQASESTSRTPGGTFTLTEGFGRLGNPGTRLSYRTINADDYWVSDTGSRLYNQFHECASPSCPFTTAAGEHLFDAGASYNYAAVINYNRWPAVPGAGSAFFLHVTNNAPTAGCVAIAQPSLVSVLRWLDPAARPLIAIGVG